jgi:co-chaperonin GroES (HSP10)
MNIRPLTGQVLIEILPKETSSAGGIVFPEHTTSPEEHQQAARNPVKPPPLHGIVRAIGNWPKLRNGMANMPEFGIGARVIVGPHAGLSMHRGIGERFRMVLIEEVLAVLT